MDAADSVSTSTAASGFGLYVHIPYCLQICTYCDFVKFEQKDLPPSSAYIELLKTEIETRAAAVRASSENSPLTSIYFGGGTPSLFSPSEILALLDAVANAGFRRTETIEMTLEINPGTLTAQTLREFLAIGINRFSVGAQTFDESLLALTGRKHSVRDTVATLELLAQAGCNYSFDLLFALPGQSLKAVEADVRRALEFSPSHLSAYCLTVPSRHPLSRGRAPDDEQAAMFECIEERLAEQNLRRYEVSNFAVPGRESHHNLLYWSDAPYWGIGIGAHSFFPRTEDSPWGVRFWNPAAIAPYKKELGVATAAPFWRQLAAPRVESLGRHEALSDWAHTALRSRRGLSPHDLERKFGADIADLILSRLAPARAAGLIEWAEADSLRAAPRWVLSKSGQALADRVFAAVTFLAEDLARIV